MSTAWLGLGSNVNAETHIRAAIDELSTQFETISLSPAYASTAVGFEGEDFINLVARVETELSPMELRQYLRLSPVLEIPRAEITKYAHVLKPLADLEPDLFHPTERRSIRDIWQSSGLDKSPHRSHRLHGLKSETL